MREDIIPSLDHIYVETYILFLRFFALGFYLLKSRSDLTLPKMPKNYTQLIRVPNRMTPKTQTQQIAAAQPRAAKPRL